MAKRSVFSSSVIFCALAIVSLTVPAKASDLAVLTNGFSIRHDHHQAMGPTTRLFFSTDDSSFTDLPTSEITSFEKDLTATAQPASESGAPVHAQVDLDEVVNEASATYHLDPDLVNSVIHAESGFNARARSPKGAQGLMQLMPSTASALGVNDAFDPQANVGGGSRYLRELLERYNFDLVKALAAYNAGPQRVEQYRGVPPFYETRAYVSRIVREYNRKKKAQEKAEKPTKKSDTHAAKKMVPAATRTATNVAKNVSSSRPQLAADTVAIGSPR